MQSNESLDYINESDSEEEPKMCCWVDMDWSPRHKVPYMCENTAKEYSGVQCKECRIWVCDFHNEDSYFNMKYCNKCGNELK